MQRSIDGVLTILQESRFQLVDTGGVAHLFILGPSAQAEPEELLALQRRQARVRVRFARAENVMADVASAVTALD